MRYLLAAATGSVTVNWMGSLVGTETASSNAPTSPHGAGSAKVGMGAFAAMVAGALRPWGL